MAKTDKPSEDNNTIDYWINTQNVPYNKLAAEFYGKIRNSKLHPEPIKLIAAFENLIFEIQECRNEQNKVLKAIDDRFKEHDFTSLERYGILIYIDKYFKYVFSPGRYRSDEWTRIGIEMQPILVIIEGEIDRLNIELKRARKKANISNEMSAKYKLSIKDGARIDLIRVLYALDEMGLIVVEDNESKRRPTKKEFMEDIGRFLGTDLTNYQKDFSKAMDSTSIETNLDIFKKMIQVIKDKQEASGTRRKINKSQGK